MQWREDFIFGLPRGVQSFDLLGRRPSIRNICGVHSSRLSLGPTTRRTRRRWLNPKGPIARNSSSRQSRISRWRLDQTWWARNCATAQTHSTRKKRCSIVPVQRCMWGRTDQKHRTPRKKQRGSCRVQQGALLKRCCSDAPVLSWTFSCEEMQNGIRAVTDANWAGDLEALRGRLLEASSSTQQVVAPSTGESGYVSITKHGCSQCHDGSRADAPSNTGNGRVGFERTKIN